MLIGVMLQAGIFQGGALGDLLTSWEQAGFFSYVLPFLLIFALVFGILTKLQIFENAKAVNAIIALVVALMSLLNNFVPTFFAQLFPRMGVGLSIILVVLIVAGLFVDPESNAMNYVLLGVGIIVVGAVIIQSAAATGFAPGIWWQQNWPIIVGAIILAILVAVIIGSSNSKGGPPPIINPKLWRKPH